MISGTSLGKTDNTSSITVCGGTDNSKGGSITIYGKDRTNNNGEFSLVANDGTSSSELWGKPNGTLTWGNKKNRYNRRTRRGVYKIFKWDSDLLGQNITYR